MRRSMVDQRWRQTWTSSEEGHTGVPVRGTSSWRHEEQEEGMGILTPGGTRRRRGLDGRASTKGGGEEASSMRSCSEH
jgi:hypothetical protein